MARCVSFFGLFVLLFPCCSYSIVLPLTVIRHTNCSTTFPRQKKRNPFPAYQSLKCSETIVDDRSNSSIVISLLSHAESPVLLKDLSAQGASPIKQAPNHTSVLREMIHSTSPPVTSLLAQQGYRDLNPSKTLSPFPPLPNPMPPNKHHITQTKPKDAHTHLYPHLHYHTALPPSKSQTTISTTISSGRAAALDVLGRSLMS